MRLRRARLDERAALEALQLRASTHLPDYREVLLAKPEVIALPDAQIIGGHVQVAERDGVVLGFAVVLPTSDGHAELDSLFVEPEHWGRGVGRALVRWAVTYAARCGGTVLQVVANPGAVAFYEACEFSVIGEVKTQFDMAPLMQRPLA